MQTNRATWLIAAFFVFASIPVLAQSIEPIGECTGACAYQQQKDAETAATWADYRKTAEPYRAICNSPHDREYADLCQQWRMAEFARQQVKWTRNQFIAAIVEIIALLATVLFTGWAAVAASHAAKAAQESVRVASETAKKQLRAYVGIEEILVGTDSISIVVRNAGQTPALDLVSKITFHWLDGANQMIPKDFNWNVSDKGDDTPAIVGVGERPKIRFAINAERFAKVRAGQMSVFALITLDYKDTDQAPHNTTVCVRYRKNAAGSDSFDNYGGYGKAT